MCQPPSSGRVRRRACCLPYPASGWRSRPSVALHVCFLTGVPRRWRSRRCSPFHTPIPPASSGVRRGGGGGDFPARRPGADARCASPVTLPCTPPAVLGMPLLTMLIVRRRRWGPVIGRERCRVRAVIAAPPSFAPPPAIHADKSTYSGEIESLDRDPGIAISRELTCLFLRRHSCEIKDL